MSALYTNFYRRQPLQRRESSSTIASSQAEIIVNQQIANEAVSASFSDLINHSNRNGQAFMNVTSSSDIKVGERNTNIYHNYFSGKRQNNIWLKLIKLSSHIGNNNRDNHLSESHVSLKKKVRHVLGQKWCWGLMFVIFILISFINTTLIVLMLTKDLMLVKREEIGYQPARPGLKYLNLPVDRVIVTHTDDGEESCKSKVVFFHEKSTKKYLDIFVLE